MSTDDLETYCKIIPGQLSKLNQSDNEFDVSESKKAKRLKTLKVYSVIVRANGREKVLAVDGKSYWIELQFSLRLLEKLGMYYPFGTDPPSRCAQSTPRFADIVITSDEEKIHLVTISSLDEKQEIPVPQSFSRQGFDIVSNSRSYYHNETERWWPHLFGPGQLSQVKTRSMFNCLIK